MNAARKKSAKELEIPPAVQEQLLSPTVDEYLRDLATHLHEPLEIRHIKIHSSRIAIEIFEKIKAFENRFVFRREEIAAHEIADPYDALTLMDEGRRELSELIAGAVIPLADITHAYDLYLTLRIGIGLEPPIAEEGLAICASVARDSHKKSNHGVWHQRLVLKKETKTPASEKKIEIGLTMVCWPGRVDLGEIHGDDGDVEKFMRLTGSDSALYRMTLKTLRIFEERRQLLSEELNNVEREAIRQAGMALRVVLIALAASRNKVLQDQLARAGADEGASFVESVKQAMQTVKSASPALTASVQQYMAAIDAHSRATQAAAVNGGALRTASTANGSEMVALESTVATETLRESRPVHPPAATQISSAEEPMPRSA